MKFNLKNRPWLMRESIAEKWFEGFEKELKKQVKEDYICAYCRMSKNGACQDSSDDCEALKLIKEILGKTP